MSSVKITFSFLVPAFIGLLLSACEDEEITARSYPRVMTNEVLFSSSGAATFQGEIFYPGNNPIVEYGFVWSTDSYPYVEKHDKETLTDPITTGTFSAEVGADLINGITYHVRAYAVTNEYLVYGKDVTFAKGRN